MTDDTINRFAGPYRFLSNFYSAVVTLDGVQYKSVEHAYQAAKTECIEMRIPFQADTLSSGYAKKLGDTLTKRPDWNEFKLVVMEDLLRQKFSISQLTKLLLATGDRPLVEGNNWGDVFWGVCDGQGENHLGRLLMKIRADRRLLNEITRGEHIDSSTGRV